MTGRLTADVLARTVGLSSLEWKLTDRLAFGLETASDLQRAVVRIADGRPLDDLVESPAVARALGDVTALPKTQPKEVVVLSGIRTGKSLMAACTGYHMAQSCDLSALRHGEVPRVSVVSLKKDLADVIMSHLVGSVGRSPLLRKTLLGSPTGESVFFRHPSGSPVEVKVVAGSRAGASLVARWSAGCIFDEFPRMVGADDGVVNWDDEREAVLNRVLPGAQLWHIGSPWAPHGPAHDVMTEHWGKPSARMVVIKAPAFDMNPVYWTTERVEAAKLTPSYKTDVLAEFTTPEEALYSAESVARCTRKDEPVVRPKKGNTYYAAMDPATRGNGWTMCIATRESGKVQIVRADEWMGSRDEPLDPAAVLEEAAGILAEYGLTSVDSDQWMGDALIALGRRVGLRIHQWRYSEKERTEKYLAIRTRMDSNELEFPPIPRLRADLLHVRKRVTPSGMSIVLPNTSDGRHCDFAPTLMMVLSRVLPEPKTADPNGFVDPETKRMRELFMSRVRGNKEDW